MARAKQVSKKVRPDSRAATVVKALLDSGDLSEVPDSHVGAGDPAFAVNVSLRGVGKWARARGMELRDHDAVELSRCLEVIGSVGWSQGDSIRFDLHPLYAARGRWSEAVSWAHDFEDDGNVWVGTNSSSPPSG